MSAHKANPVLYSSQEIDNESFNDTYKIKQGAMYIYQASSNSFVPAQADASGNLLTAGGSGGSAGTQYAEAATTAPATGTVSLGRYKASAPTLTDGQLYGLQLDAGGNLKVAGTFSAAAPTPASTGTITSVAGSATSATLLAANAARKFATFYNESTATLYLAFAATSSTTAYTVQVPPNGFYELSINYSGAIAGIWSSANGNVRITEIT